MFDAQYRQLIGSPMASAEMCVETNLDDTATLQRVTKAICIREACDVALVPGRGKRAVIFRNLPSGAILNVGVRPICATGTTSHELVELA